MLLSLNEEALVRSAQEAETVDLLDRVTAYRPGMEPLAVAIFEEELFRRNVTRRQIDAHAEAVRRECLMRADGTALQCSCCRRPAVAHGWGWLRLFRVVPALPWRCYYCASHRPTTPA